MQSALMSWKSSIPPDDWLVNSANIFEQNIAIVEESITYNMADSYYRGWSPFKIWFISSVGHLIW